MALWTFYDFKDSRGNNLIRKWLDGLLEKASAKIDARVFYMRAIPIWPEQYVSALVGWPGLVELRVGSAGNQYRPIGFYGPDRREFTIVLGAIEKGILPKRVLEAAYDNRRTAIADRSRICEHQFNQGATIPKPLSERGI